MITRLSSTAYPISLVHPAKAPYLTSRTVTGRPLPNSHLVPTPCCTFPTTVCASPPPSPLFLPAPLPPSPRLLRAQRRGRGLQRGPAAHRHQRWAQQHGPRVKPCAAPHHGAQRLRAAAEGVQRGHVLPGGDEGGRGGGGGQEGREERGAALGTRRSPAARWGRGRGAAP